MPSVSSFTIPVMRYASSVFCCDLSFSAKVFASLRIRSTPSFASFFVSTISVAG